MHNPTKHSGRLWPARLALQSWFQGKCRTEVHKKAQLAQLATPQSTVSSNNYLILTMTKPRKQNYRWWLSHFSQKFSFQVFNATKWTLSNFMAVFQIVALFFFHFSQYSWLLSCFVHFVLSFMLLIGEGDSARCETCMDTDVKQHEIKSEPLETCSLWLISNLLSKFDLWKSICVHLCAFVRETQRISQLGSLYLVLACHSKNNPILRKQIKAQSGVSARDVCARYSIRD